METLDVDNAKVRESQVARLAQIKGVTDQANLFLKKGNSAMDSVNGAAGDLKAFIVNLRQHGIIFYRDTASSDGPLKKKN